MKLRCDSDWYLDKVVDGSVKSCERSRDLIKCVTAREGNGAYRFGCNDKRVVPYLSTARSNASVAAWRCRLLGLELPVLVRRPMVALVSARRPWPRSGATAELPVGVS